MGEMNPTMLNPDDDDLDLEDEPAEEQSEGTPEEAADEESEEPEETEGDETSETSEQPENEVTSAGETTIEEGAILEGEVVKTDDVEAYVDIGWQSEGILPYDQLREGSITEGEEITVKIVDMNGEAEAPRLSEKEAMADIAWDRVRAAQQSNEAVEGTVFKKIKGGFLVRLKGGLTAFMPMSHISLSKKKNHDRFIDKTFDMKILEQDRDEDNVVVSRKKYLEEQQEEQKSEFFQEHDVDDWVDGTVKNIVNFGAFINLGPVDGLLHISDIAWGQVRNVEDYLSQGDDIEVKILSLDPSESKVSLGLKQKYPDPWENIDEKYTVDEVTTGEIVDVWDDGVFVRLEQHVEGKIDESELSWIESWNHPSDQFEEGEKIKVKIQGIDEERRIISLSHKQINNNPWKILKERFPEGTVLKAPVVDIHQEHINVQLLESVKGIIRKPDISWEDEDLDLYETFSIGEKIKCKVLELDPDDQTVRLGVKQTTPDPWVKKARNYPVGTTLEGEVTNVLQFGAFVQLEEDLEGLVHVSEMAEGKRVNPHEIVSEGDTVGVKVLDIDEDEHKVDLSIQEYEKELQKQEMEEYMEEEGSDDSEMTMGEMLGDDLDDIVQD